MLGLGWVKKKIVGLGEKIVISIIKKKVEKMNFLDGKKTIIGGVILWIALFLQDVIIGQMGVSIAWLPQVIAILNWIGGFLMPVGLGHKAIKVSKNG